MKFLKRLKSGNFWISMISAVVLILQAVFDIEIKTEYLNQIILGILGILVMSGIVSESPSEEITVKQADISSVLDNIGEKLCNALSSGVETNTNIVANVSNENAEKQDAVSVVAENLKSNKTSTIQDGACLEQFEHIEFDKSPINMATEIEVGNKSCEDNLQINQIIEQVNPSVQENTDLL